MRGLSILVLLVLVLPTTQPGPSSPPVAAVDLGDECAALGGAPDHLLITEVCPGRPAEYVIVSNPGPDRQLNGTAVGDGEGNITLCADIILPRGASLAVTNNGTVFESLHPGVRCLEKGDPGLSWGGRFALADGGDCAFLYGPDGQMVDAVSYGSSQYQGPGWGGPAAASVPKAHALVRVSGDLDSASDWRVQPPGRSGFEAGTFEAIVEPFSAPENAAQRLARELSLASRVVNCSVYELSDPGVVSALAKCSRRGVAVNVLVEGQPVGGMSNASLAAVATLQASRVEVREVRSADSYRRYDYLHAKYMVVDGRRTVVMSENWGTGLDSNRGWGVCLDGAGVAAYFDGVFGRDFNGALDVEVPRAPGPTLDAVEVPPCDLAGLVRHRCRVTALVSPDNAERQLHDLLSRAERTVLVEQLSIDKDWLSRPGLVADLLSAAARGVRVRVLLDDSWGAGENKVLADALNAKAEANGLDLEARVISNYHGLSVMHNKGLVVDDQVVVSSINWGDSALRENREAGVVVSSPEVTAYFSGLFWSDWSVDPIPPVARLPWAHTSVRVGEVTLLDGTGSTDNARALTYEWDLDADDSVDNTSSTWAARLPEGNHTIRLTVRDLGNNTATATCWVEVLPEARPGQTLSPLLLAAPAVVPLAVIIWKRIIRKKRY